MPVKYKTPYITMPGHRNIPKPKVQAAKIRITGKPNRDSTTTRIVETIFTRPEKSTIYQSGRSDAISIHPVLIKIAKRPQAMKKLATSATQGKLVLNIFPP